METDPRPIINVNQIGNIQIAVIGAIGGAAGAFVTVGLLSAAFKVPKQKIPYLSDKTDKTTSDK